jgi:hypothetical protein
MEYYWELIAALKVRTSNKKGRHLSTGEAIRLGSMGSFISFYLQAVESAQ